LLRNQAAPADETYLEEKLDARFMQEFLSGIVEELPEKARLIFHYSRDLELSVTEIAGKMDLSPKAVEYHITKALRSLREALGKIKSVFF
jgi:RNA polymerase sigma-70 factor (ECF subfamily)